MRPSDFRVSGALVQGVAPDGRMPKPKESATGHHLAPGLPRVDAGMNDMCASAHVSAVRAWLYPHMLAQVCL